jgi:hypothetical protein
MSVNTSEEPSPLSDKDIMEIKRRCDQATPGPWRSYVEGRDMMSGSTFIQTGGEDIYLTGATVADQDFIAHARQDILDLIAEIERLRNC